MFLEKNTVRLEKAPEKYSSVAFALSTVILQFLVSLDQLLLHPELLKTCYVRGSMQVIMCMCR